MTADLNGKVMYITGAGRGIGRGIAEAAAAAGADVAINALTPTYVDDLAARIAKESGQRVIPVTGDVTTTNGAQRAFDQVLRELGRVDIVVNNLGDSIYKPLVALPDGEEHAMSDADVAKVIDLNLTSAIVTSQAAGQHMLERRAGKVINISSFAVFKGGAGRVIYATAKTAMIGLTRSLALEWAPYNIQVNAVAPGIFPDLVTSGDQFEASREKAAKITPAGRAGDPVEVGYAVCFLASSEADYITGQTLTVDGGLSLA